MELLKLAERCEAATGPDRELDESIASEVYRDNCRNPMWDCGPLLAYTASIDAAMALVPEGFDWIIARTNGGLTIHAEVGDREQVFGETPALALCASALRARAALKEPAPVSGTDAVEVTPFLAEAERHLRDCERQREFRHGEPSTTERLLAKAVQSIQSLSRTEELVKALERVELISTNHGGWYETNAWGWGQMMGGAARDGLASHREQPK